MTMKNYLSQDSEIQSRKQTGLCAKCQRQVAKTIKRARNFGILPHLGHYEIQATSVAQLDDSANTSLSRVKVSKVVFK
jgi:hypothetical protein